MSNETVTTHSLTVHYLPSLDSIFSPLPPLPPSLQAKAYFINIMETVAFKDYIIVYFNAGCQSDALPDSSFFKELYHMVDPK